MYTSISLRRILSNRFVIVSLFIIAYTSTFAQNRLQNLDDQILLDLAAHRTPEQTKLMLFLSHTNDYVDYGVPAGLLVAGVIGKDRDMRENAGYIASSTAISFGLTMLLKHVIQRPRPFIKNLKIVSVYRAGATSFPSGHTSTSFATATAVSMAYPKWYVIAPSFLWAGAVGYSRMYLGVHYPTDVTAGALLGAGSAISMSFLKAR